MIRRWIEKIILEQLGEKVDVLEQDIQWLRLQLGSIPTFEEHDAVSFAVKKTLSDTLFMEKAKEQEVAEECVLWACHFCQDHEILINREKLQTLVRARLTV